MFTGVYNAKFDRFFFYLKSSVTVDDKSLDEYGLEDWIAYNK